MCASVSNPAEKNGECYKQYICRHIEFMFSESIEGQGCAINQYQSKVIIRR